jgi:peptide deformylase
VLINPEIELLSPLDLTFFEGCLSLPGFVAMVPRAEKVRVNALNELGEPIRMEAEGWYARILQHEIDHLGGALYIDRMWSRSFCTLDNYTRLWKSKSTADLAHEFGPAPDVKRQPQQTHNQFNRKD